MQSNAQFDFDEWQHLAARDPAEFERRRAVVIGRFLAGVGPDKALLVVALQKEIDAKRRQVEDPLQSLQAIMAMLCSSLQFLGEGLEVLADEIDKTFPRKTGQ